MNETEYRPRAKWWGFVKDNRRFLCRYSHIFAIFDLIKKEVIYSDYETITDKRGVLFAIKYFNENGTDFSYDLEKDFWKRQISDYIFVYWLSNILMKNNEIK